MLLVGEFFDVKTIHFVEEQVNCVWQVYEIYFLLWVLLSSFVGFSDVKGSHLAGSIWKTS